MSDTPTASGREEDDSPLAFAGLGAGSTLVASLIPTVNGLVHVQGKQVALGYSFELMTGWVAELDV